jgi:hypothetical protein
MDAVTVSLLVPFGKQDGLSLGFDARGTVIEETYDAAGVLKAQRTSPFALTFVMRRATGGAGSTWACCHLGLATDRERPSPATT